MAFGTYNHYTGTGRPVEDMGQTTPEVELSESIRPWGEFLPAPYIPITRIDVHKRANIVMSVGTPVAFDSQGALIPAGIPDGHVFEYGTSDYQTGHVATLRADTGAAVTSSVTEAAMHADLLATSRFARGVGVTSYNVFSHEGGTSFTSWPTYTLNYDNPSSYGIHNTMSQDLVAITCDYQILVPYVAGKNLLGDSVKVLDSDNSSDVAVLSSDAKSYAFAHDELIPLASSISGVLSSGLSVVYISPNCGTGDDGSGGTFGLDGTAATAQFQAPGDTHGTAVDASTVGLHVVKSTDTAKYVVLKNTNTNADSDPHMTAGTGAITSGTFTATLASAIKPGDGVVPRAGKFVKFDAARHDADEMMGQVLGVDSNVTNKSYLAHVKTAYDRATSPGDMMPGSATRGVPFSLHMVTDGAWRQYTTAKSLTGTTLAGTLTAPALRLVQINIQR